MINRAAGLTLLELVVSLLILSILTTVAIRSTSGLQDQTRFNSTEKTLAAVYSGIIGDQHLISQGQKLQAGFAVDNGLLPQTAGELQTKPTGFDDYSPQSPVFDAAPDALTGINNDAGVSLAAAHEQLWKGYRAPYLIVNGSIQDGWGQTMQPDQRLDANADGLFERYEVGSAGAPGNPIYTVVPRTVEASQWLLDIQGWSVTLQSQQDIAANTVMVSLLVYQNDTDTSTNFNWRRLSSNMNVCLDGDGDGLVLGVACTNNGSVSITFPVGTPLLVPHGQHLLVLVQDDDAIAHNGSAGELLCQLPLCAQRVTQRVRFYARASLPEAIRLVL